MKYTSEIIIELPLNKFISKFDNSENMKHWQKGLVSVEHVSGEPGQVGAKMKLNYLMGRRPMTLIETVTHRKLPYEFHGTYSTKNMDNITQNYFEETSKGRTKWTSVCEFIPMTFSMRAMLWMMPRAFKKQSAQYMNDFKNFAEKGISVAHA